MTTEFQPVDPRIPFYIPENWIQPTGANSGSFVTFPTAQTANISFPGTILCSNLQSFAPTAGMNLFNNSTTGNIQIANANGYTGGIVINANNTAPVANETIIGTSVRPLVAPFIKTSAIEGQGFIGSIVNVNSDLNIGSGFQLNTNEIEPTVSAPLRIAGSNNVEVNIGGVAVRTQNINIGSNSSVSASSGSVNIMTGSRQSGNFNVLTSTNVENTGAITLGNYRGELRLLSQLTNPIPLAVYNPITFPYTLTGTDRPAASLLATANVNGARQYVYRYSPSVTDTGNYFANICITFECSTHFSPWLQWEVYRRVANITTNTALVPGTDTQLTNFFVIQKYYTTSLGDKMTVNLSGIVNFNPLNNAAANTIGVVVKWLEFVSGTFTLSQVSTVATYMRIA